MSKPNYTFSLEVIPGDKVPTQPGHYLVWMDEIGKPTVLWWSKFSTDWRRGCTRVNAFNWAGPLPEKGAKA